MMTLLRKIRFAAGTAMEVAFGLVFLSPSGQALWKRWQHRSQRSADNVQSTRLGMVAHVFYPDMLPEILDIWRRFPAGSKLVVTTTPETLDKVRAGFEGVDATIRVLENRGRDIAPLLHLLAEGVFDDFDAVLKLHTKRSPHLLNGGIRRRMLLAMLGGSDMQIRKAANQFQSPRVGVVGWAACYRTRPAYWMANRERVTAAMKAVGSLEQPAVAFFEGSMFWFRPQAIKVLAIPFGDQMAYEHEAGQLDGALQHAIERCFVLAAAHEGYDTHSMSGKRLYAAAAGKNR
ncbi:MAG: rhamnan synthesis F family protein [Hoeflea sp.]|uniref:rhamnan synthesis F family protein n=1 Tax=Hoeflea sp. TaxID=1940281 RepID=UPI0032976E29